MKIKKTQEKDLIVYTVTVNNNTHSFCHPADLNIDMLDIVNILLDKVDKEKTFFTQNTNDTTTAPFNPFCYNPPSHGTFFNPYCQQPTITNTKSYQCQNSLLE